MALTKCPECSTEVSDKAEKCPKCACPINSVPSEKVVIIEQTGKKLKGQLIYASLVMIIGIIIMMTTATDGNGGGAGFGGLLMTAGFIWIIVVKFKIWWNHS